jgi:hypothetical protein
MLPARMYIYQTQKSTDSAMFLAFAVKDLRYTLE